MYLRVSGNPTTSLLTHVVDDNGDGIVGILMIS